MRRHSSLFDVISKFTNEKVAVHAALFVAKQVPDTRLTHRTVQQAKFYTFWIQRTYDICHECSQPIIGKHAEITGHITHVEPDPEDIAEDIKWVQRIQAAARAQQAATTPPNKEN